MEVFGEDLLEDVVFEPVGYYWSGEVSGRLSRAGSWAEVGWLLGPTWLSLAVLRAGRSGGDLPSSGLPGVVSPCCRYVPRSSFGRVSLPWLVECLRSGNARNGKLAIIVTCIDLWLTVGRALYA